MMSFIGGDCLDLAPGSIPKRRPRSWRRARAAGAGAGAMPAESRWKARRSPGVRPGSIRLGPLRAVRGRDVGASSRSPRCACGALIGYFVFPTYPTYDSFYALLWGRDLLHLHLPDFRVYRGPTEHPLAIAFGMFCSIFGAGRRAADGARLDRLVRRARRRHVPARAAVLRPGRRASSPGCCVLSRFFLENLAAQGYLDITYIALIVWAVVLEVEQPRRGAAGARGCSPPPGCCARTRGC